MEGGGPHFNNSSFTPDRDPHGSNPLPYVRPLEGTAAEEQRQKSCQLLIRNEGTPVSLQDPKKPGGETMVYHDLNPVEIQAIPKDSLGDFNPGSVHKEEKSETTSLFQQLVTDLESMTETPELVSGKDASFGSFHLNEVSESTSSSFKVENELLEDNFSNDSSNFSSSLLQLEETLVEEEAQTDFWELVFRLLLQIVNNSEDFE